MGKEIDSEFDSLAGNWENHPLTKLLSSENQFLIYTENISFHSDMDCLEVGCGTGSFASLLVDSVRSITGIDTSEKMLEHFLKRAESQPKLKGLKGSITELHFPPQSFDVVYMNNVLHHINDPVESLRLLYQVLKPNGIIIIGELRSDVSKQTISESHHDSIGHFHGHGQNHTHANTHSHSPVHFHNKAPGFSEGKIAEMLIEAGFTHANEKIGFEVDCSGSGYPWGDKIVSSFTHKSTIELV